jgi:hypothetical protein
MPVVGRRRDESIGVPASGAVAGAVRPIPSASSIEARGGGIGIAARGVVDAARLQIPCGESRRCSADDESRRECNLGLVQHCCISLSRFRPARVGDGQVARRHPSTFRSKKLILKFNASYHSDERCLQAQSCRGIGATRGEAEAGLRKTPLSFCFSEALGHRMLDPVVVGALVPASAAAAGRGRCASTGRGRRRSWSARRLRRGLCCFRRPFRLFARAVTPAVVAYVLIHPTFIAALEHLLGFGRSQGKHRRNGKSEGSSDCEVAHCPISLVYGNCWGTVA